MLSKPQRHLARDFMKIFLRDRQSIFFSLFFPVVFLGIFAFIRGGGPEPIALGVANQSDSAAAARFVDALREDFAFSVVDGDEDQLREQLVLGEQMLVLVLPPGFGNSQSGDAPGRANGPERPSGAAGARGPNSESGQAAALRLLADTSQFNQMPLVRPMLEQKLMSIERELRGDAAMFDIEVENVQALSQSYLDFLLPGLLGMMLMQLSIAGSGYNVVEFRRKGILKRLFVTPIMPRDFVAAIVAARLGIVLLQLTVLLAFALFVLDVRIIGNFAEFYFVAIIACLVFLNIGFCIGSMAKTQQSIIAIGNLVIFPQIVLSGVFYPIDAMPGFVQPFAQVLPLTFVVSGLRDIAVAGETLAQILPSLAGMAVWFVIGFALATKMFVWKEVAA